MRSVASTERNFVSIHVHWDAYYKRNLYDLHLRQPTTTNTLAIARRAQKITRVSSWIILTGRFAVPAADAGYYKQIHDELPQIIHRVVLLKDPVCIIGRSLSLWHSSYLYSCREINSPPTQSHLEARNIGRSSASFDLWLYRVRRWRLKRADWRLSIGDNWTDHWHTTFIALLASCS